MDGTIPWVKIADATRSGKFIRDTAEHVNEYGASFSRYLPSGTILVAASGVTLGFTTILGIDGCAHDGWLILQNLRGLDRDFAYYCLKRIERLFHNSSSGAAIQNINTDILRQTKIPCPPLPVQLRIAGILSAYDELIENNQRRIKILEEMARSLYREWFVHFRFPGHDKVKMVPSSLGPVPQDWEVVSIDDVCARVTDGSHSSPKSVDEGMPMASSKDMHDWGLTMETCRLISREDFDELVHNDCKPKKNDVLITKDGANYLQHIFVNREERGVVLLSSIAILRPSARVNPHLLAATLSAPEAKGRLKNYVTGAAIPRIVLKDFKRFEFVLPSQQVQVEWARLAEPLTKLCWELSDQINNLRRTRDLMLPRLLSGQVNIEAL